jgi:cytochrome c oxidase cbb3-type subunit 2
MLSLHKLAERHAGLLIFGILAVASIGGLAQVVPVLFSDEVSSPAAGVKPYGALELAGRDIYIRESCSLCHSQQIRPLLAEVRRYGAAAQSGEFVFDRPFLWGSKRTGPDLQRVGGKFSDEWHRVHLLNPRAVAPTSIMPAYPWLDKNILCDSPESCADFIAPRLRALAILGHPYSEEDIENAPAALAGKSEMDAIIAYLQTLGAAR